MRAGNELANDEPVVSVAQFTQLADSYSRKNGNWKKAGDRKENNNGRAIESSDGVRRCWECNKEGHVARNCPNIEQHSHSKSSLKEKNLAAVVRLKIISRKEEKETKRKKLNFR